MDIRISEHEKRIVRLGVNLFRKKLGKKASKENISKYLRQSKNKALLEILNVVDVISENTKSEFQQRLVKEYAEFGLFLAVNHPELKKGIEGLFKEFTKYDNVELDLKPCLSKIDMFLFEHMLKYIMKRFSSRRTYEAIMSESITTQNKIARYFISNVDNAIKHVNDDFMQRTLKTFAWFGVWVGVNDTAYRHQFYWGSNKIGNETLVKLSEEFYREPEDWFINLYTDGVNETRQLHAENKIPHHETSILERPCVVKYQQDVIAKHNKKYGVK